MVTACPSAINASTTAGPRKSVPPKTRTFFGVRANTFDVPATKRPKDDAADVRINRLRFITGCDLHLDAMMFSWFSLPEAALAANDNNHQISARIDLNVRTAQTISESGSRIPAGCRALRGFSRHLSPQCTIPS